jgi:hypothetical protein
MRKKVEMSAHDRLQVILSTLECVAMALHTSDAVDKDDAAAHARLVRSGSIEDLDTFHDDLDLADIGALPAGRSSKGAAMNRVIDCEGPKRFFYVADANGVPVS